MFDENLAKGLPVILLAETDVVVRNLLLRVLHPIVRAVSPPSFAVLVAANSDEAIQLSRSFHGEVSLLITDMEMPRMGGTQLTELMIRERPGIRVLEISKNGVETIVDRNHKTAFLQKPFTVSVLIEKIRDILTAPQGTKKTID